MSRITLIAAAASNGVIGCDDNTMPFHISEDLKHFRKTTEGHVVVMGRKTFESLNRKPLPNRTNIVLSRQRLQMEEDVSKDYGPTTRLIFTPNFNTAFIDWLRSLDDEIFIIGGGEIYGQTIDIADRLIISHIPFPAQGSVKFPEIDLDKWEVTDTQFYREASFPFCIVTYEKIK